MKIRKEKDYKITHYRSLQFYNLQFIIYNFIILLTYKKNLLTFHLRPFVLQLYNILIFNNTFFIIFSLSSFMQLFRKKYLYNSENPIFANENVKTYNCMDTQTKNNRLLLLQHLKEPADVQSDKYTLQPLQYPTLSEPYSVYTLVNCCSEIGKLNQNDTMYILQCLTSSKVRKPLYYLVSPQGVCCSEIQGLLPNRSPDLFTIALELLDLQPNLIQVQRSIVSKQGYLICRAIRDGIIDSSYFSAYGWKDAKKQSNIKDQNFWIFKGRRKQQSPFNEEYALAWNSKYGMSRMKYIDLNKDAFQEDFQQDFNRRIRFYQLNESSSTISLLKIHKVVKDTKGIKIFTSIANQGNFAEYIDKKQQLNQKLSEYSAQSLLQNFIKMMAQIAGNDQIKGHSSMHICNVYVHDNRITLGQPLFITDKKQKKLRDLKKNFDYFAPQFKQNIILPEKLFKLDQQKIDIWSFGFLLHRLFTKDVPNFDSGKNPIIKKAGMSEGMINLIKKCLNQDPQLRPRWSQINLRDLSKGLQIQQYNHEQQQKSEQQKKSKKLEIRLDSPIRQRKEKLEREASFNLKQMKSVDSQRLIRADSNVKQEYAKLAVQEEDEQQKKKREQEQMEYLLPPQISSKLKRIKLTIKIIIIMVMYIVVFFGPFLQRSFQILLLKNQLKKAPLNLVDSSGNILSSFTILTSQSKFFLFNDISFSDIQNQYHCINDRFDPVNNPDYSLYGYITSASFTTLILTGWASALIICVIKALSIWKGGISNRPRKPNKKFWVVYAFHQLSLASLLFAHFFIYQFFYFSGINPCFSIDTYDGVQPMFDSSLYLFLSNQSGYMQKVFSTLGVLACVMTISGCFYAWAPKFDLKYFLTVPSILCRLVPYILLFLLCRIGVFSLFSPTALNDSTEIILSIIQSTSKGFFGIIPQVFILICITIEVVLELMLYYCQQKASQSDSLSKLFNINDIKTLKRQFSYNSNVPSYGMDKSLNQMSLQNSKQNLNDYY